jgi:hypothetical protein
LTALGDGRDDIYLTDDARALFLSVLGQACERFNWECHSYCLMATIITSLIEGCLSDVILLTAESLICHGPVNAYIPMTYCLLALSENHVRDFSKIHSVLALVKILTVRLFNFMGTSLGNRKPRSSIRR